MPEPDIAFASIAELGAAYRSGRVSPVAATRLCLDRIARFDGQLNAFLTVLEDSALAAAAAAERELAAGRDRGPLHGVPVALKDLVAMAGVASKFGAHETFIEHPAHDALLVARLREAGAVIIGKTNLLEFAYGAVHPAVGQTNNPWNLQRTSGGSSGGSAAAVAAGMCYAALGTDTGGSIRCPASYCGIAGLKPSYGLVPLDGVQTLSWSFDHGGPLARSSADAAILLAAMAGRPVSPQPPAPGRLRLALAKQHVEARSIRPGVRAAFDAACTRLRDAGARFELVDMPELDLALEALMMVMLPEAAIVHTERLARHAAAFSHQTRLQIEQGFLVPGVTQLRGRQLARRLAARFADSFRSVDAFLSPTEPWVALAADASIDDPEGQEEMRFVAPYNLVGLPALSVRCGTGEDGLPVGLQIAGPPGGDAAVLAIGMLVESQAGPVPPPPLA